jgi:hypothetical protein
MKPLYDKDADLLQATSKRTPRKIYMLSLGNSLLIKPRTQPNFMPEFQGGSYNPWGGPEGGCPSDLGVDFANMFYRNLIYQRVTGISLYMLFGGTSWGWHAAPVVGEPRVNVPAYSSVLSLRL